MKCRTCGKAVTPKRGKLSCCGHVETVEYVVGENRRHKYAQARHNRKMSQVILGDTMSDAEDQLLGNLDDETGEVLHWNENIPNLD